MKSNILKIHYALKQNALNFVDLIQQRFIILNKYKECNSVITNLQNQIEEKNYSLNMNEIKEQNLLYGIPYSLKDNICTKDLKTTAGSVFLKDFVPQYSAFIYEILEKQKAILLSKDSMDEFGLGGTGKFCFTGEVKNPLNLKKMVAGSSSGSACNVAIGFSTFALVTDTGDSIVKPSSYVGIVGYKPTYGLISRNGIIPYCPSQDTVGIMTKYVADACIVGSYIEQYDQNDPTCQKMSQEQEVKLSKLMEIKHIKFGIYKNLINKLDINLKNQFFQFCNLLQKKGHTIVFLDFDENIFSLMLVVYQVLTFSCACSCHSNLIGNLFGTNVTKEVVDYETFAIKNRTTSFGQEFKSRLVIGSYLMNEKNFVQIYTQACKFRKLIQEKQLSSFKLTDAILMPCCCSEAIDLNDDKQNLDYDNHLIMDNFTGNPSISLP